MKKRILIALVIIAIGVTAVMIKRNNSRVDDGSLPLSGNVEVTEVDLGFKSSGRLSELLVEEGQRVKKGDRLAVLERAELEGLVNQNRAHLSEMQARVEELKVGSRPQELEQAGAGVRAAGAELVKAKNDYGRAEMLYKNGAISEQQMDAAKRGYDVAMAQHQKAVEVMSLAKEGPRKEELKAAKERIQQATAALRVSEERLNDAVLYAPVSGVVLRKNIEPGETVASGVPVYTIGDLENPWVKVYVKEDKLGLLKLGHKAGVTVDSYPGKIYEGKVTYLSSEAEFTPKSVQTQEERVKLVFGAKVSVKNVNDELKPGMPADVRIKLQ